MKYLVFLGCMLLVLAQPGHAGTAAIAYPCRIDEECQRFEDLQTRSICSGGHCMCHTPSDENYKNCALNPSLLRDSKLGSPIGRPCKLDTTCNFENGHCNTTTSQCGCKHGFISSIHSKTCEPVAISIGGKCTSEKQCLAGFRNTTCSNGQCVCIDGFHQNNGSCWKSIGINESCLVTDECLKTPRAICNESNKCSCSSKDTLSKNGTTCLSGSLDMTDSCSSDEECQASFENAQCVEKSCKCLENYHFFIEIKKCIASRDFGESCKDDYECRERNSTSSNSHLKCASDKCTCADNFQRVDNQCVASDPSASGTSRNGLSVLLGGLVTIILFFICSNKH